MTSEQQGGGGGSGLSREVLARLCRTASERLPDDEQIEQHWHPEWREYVRALKSLVYGAAKADIDNWDEREIERFTITLNALSSGLSTGYGMGLRDGTGVVFWTVRGVPLDNSDPHGCGEGPSVPEGASCSMRCHLERDWCLCREGCGETVDCSGWPCSTCVDCNLTHAICAVDCIFVLPQPPTDFTNPTSFKEFEYPLAPS